MSPKSKSDLGFLGQEEGQGGSGVRRATAQVDSLLPWEENLGLI